MLLGQDPQLPEYSANNIYQLPIFKDKLEPFERNVVSPKLYKSDPNDVSVVMST